MFKRDDSGSVDPRFEIELRSSSGLSFRDEIQSLNEPDLAYDTKILKQGFDFAAEAVLVEVPFGFDLTFFVGRWKVDLLMRPYNRVARPDEVIVDIARQVHRRLSIEGMGGGVRGAIDRSDPGAVVFSAGSGRLSQRFTCDEDGALISSFSSNGGRRWESLDRSSRASP